MTVDVARIDQLYIDYVNIVDDGDLEQWPELFTEDCSYRIVSRENVRRGLPLATMRCDSRDMLRDRVNAIQSSAFYVSRVVRHIVGLLDVRPDDDHIAVRANFAVFESLSRSATTLLCTGVYDDVVVIEDGQPRFRQKHCIYDGDLVIDSIVYPL
ncbi:MAG: salicylate 5-hydroxylase small subunit [Acidimicrobiaceae bacterium]